MGFIFLSGKTGWGMDPLNFHSHYQNSHCPEFGHLANVTCEALFFLIGNIATPNCIVKKKR